MKIDAVLFDKDGTLFDFHATWGAWTKGLILKEAGADADMQDRLAEALGFDLATGAFRPDSTVIAGSAGELADLLLPILADDDRDALLARMNALAAAAPQVEVTPLVPFLLHLAAADLAIGVATNDAEAPARAHLRGAGCEDMFDFIAGYDSGHGVKPGPGPLLAFATSVGVLPQNCAMVGDSLHDLHAARAAGFVSIGVLTGMATRADLAPAADVVLESIADLPVWLET